MIFQHSLYKKVSTLILTYIFLFRLRSSLILVDTEFVELRKQDRVKRRTAGNPNHYQMCGLPFAEYYLWTSSLLSLKPLFSLKYLLHIIFDWLAIFIMNLIRMVCTVGFYFYLMKMKRKGG